MIHMELLNINWGTNAVPEVPNARKLNLKDNDAEILVSVTFGQDPLKKMILEMCEGCTQEQLQEIAVECHHRAVEMAKTASNGGTLVEGGDYDVPTPPEFQ